LQMDEAPDGIPTLSDWKFQKNSVGGGIVKGTAKGELVSFGVKSQDVQYGNVIQDSSGNKYFLRDDFAFRDLTVMPQAPGVPTLKQSHIRDGKLYANIYNDRYDGHNDGEQVEIETNWREPDTPAKGSTVIDGGHLVKDTRGRTYYVERKIALLPPQLNTRWAIEARRRLPSVGNDATIQDVLEDVFRDGHAREALGSCLAMPRVLFGPREDEEGPKDASPEGFANSDFVTLRYHWHAKREDLETNKFQKTIVDVSRLPTNILNSQARNIHVPLNYYCRVTPPRYSASLLRVVSLCRRCISCLRV
jgi:hypothetical protein